MGESAAGDAPQPRAGRPAALDVSPLRRRKRDATGALQFETDRARFLGQRARDIRDAACHRRRRGRCRTPLAPCSIRCSRCGAGCALLPAQSARIAFWSGIAPSRPQALALSDKYRDISAFDRSQIAGGDPRFGTVAHARHRCRRGAAIPMHGQPGAVRRLVAARCARDPDRNALGPPVLWSLRHLGRFADRAGADRRQRPAAISSSGCCERTAIGRRSDWPSIW